MDVKAPKYEGDMCFGAGGCLRPSGGRFPSNYEIGGVQRCDVLGDEPETRETRVDDSIINELRTTFGIHNTLLDYLVQNETSCYFVIGHSSYDSVFDVGPEGRGEERSVKFDQPATMFQVPENCYYVSTSATGWGLLSSETATSLGTDLEDHDHMLNSPYDKVMGNLFSDQYTCRGGKLGDKDKKGKRPRVVDPDSRKPARIGVQVYGSNYDPVPQDDWLQIEQTLAEEGCPGLLTLQSGYFLPRQWAYNKSHQFYGGPLTRDGFGIIELSFGSQGALQDALLAVDGIAGRTRSHYVPGAAEIQEAIDDRRLTHMPLTDAEGNAAAGSVYFAKSRAGGEMKKEEIACWNLIRKAVGGGQEKEVYMSDIMKALKREDNTPIVVCALSCSEQYVKMHDRKRGVVAYTPQQLAEMGRSLEIDFAATMIDPSLIPEKDHNGVRVMGAMVASSLQLQTTMHVSNGKLWDAACSINARSGDGGTNPLVVGWSGTESTSQGTSLTRLLARRSRTTKHAVVDSAKALIETTGAIAKLALPCFFAAEWLAPLINVSDLGAMYSSLDMGAEEVEMGDPPPSVAASGMFPMQAPLFGMSPAPSLVAPPVNTTAVVAVKGPTRIKGKGKMRREARGPYSSGGRRRLATRKRRRLPRRRTKVRKPRLKKKTRKRKNKSRKRTRRRR